MTGYFAGGSREGIQRARQTQCCSRFTHLAKLNPNCHMNYLDYLQQNGNLPIAIIDFLSNYIDRYNGDIREGQNSEYLLSKVNFPAKSAI